MNNRQSQGMINIALVAAIAENNVIGRKNQLPWRLKGELKIFSRITKAHAVIMGRKTYDSLPTKPLPERLNLVISRDKKLENQQNTIFCENLENALEAAKNWSLDQAVSKNTIMIIGGAEIYRLALPYANIFYKTTVHTSADGDTFFPEFNRADWCCSEILFTMNAEGNYHGYTVEKWIRNNTKIW